MVKVNCYKCNREVEISEEAADILDMLSLTLDQPAGLVCDACLPFTPADLEAAIAADTIN
jgi:hypothetical protein